MNARVPGQAAFERIRCEIESGAAHWGERDDGRGPYGLQGIRQHPGNGEADDRDEADDGTASTSRF